MGGAGSIEKKKTRLRNTGRDTSDSDHPLPKVGVAECAGVSPTSRQPGQVLLGQPLQLTCSTRYTRTLVVAGTVIIRNESTHKIVSGPIMRTRISYIYSNPHLIMRGHTRSDPYILYYPAMPTQQFVNLIIIGVFLQIIT